MLKRQKRKPATVNGAILALRRFYALAGASPDDNPAARIQLVKEQAMAPKDLDRNQLNRLMREARSVSEGATERQRLLATRDATILALLRETGIRVSELVSLTPADVFTQERRLWVHIRGKGQKERNVPLNELASQFLRAWLEVRPADLPTLFGVGDRMVRLRLREIGRRAKIEGVHPHTLRHSFARGVLDEGGNLVDIAAILGHNSVRTTQRYTQPRPKSLMKTVDLLDPH
jgi:integrase/recombinase XerC